MEPEHIVDDGTNEWHLVSPARSGRPSLECSERSGVASRPHTPATSAPEHPAEEVSRALGVPSEPAEAAAVPSPELLEQAARTGDGGDIAATAVDQDEVAPRTATDDEALLDVQGLSQEGSLEGFTTTTTTTTTLPQDPAPEPAINATPAAAEPSAAAEQEAAAAADGEAAPPAKRLAADEEGDSWLLGLADGIHLGVGAGLHLPGVGTLFELLGEGLGWTQGYLLEACRAGLQNLQLYLALTQQTLTRGAVSVAGGAALAHQQAHLHLADALTRAHKVVHAHLPRRSPTTGTAAEEGEAVKARPNHATLAPLSLRGGLLVGALGITTIASLAGLIFYLGRCRQLTAQLQQRDRELARLVVKILNLQDALQQPRAGPPVLRQTRLLSVTSGLM